MYGQSASESISQLLIFQVFNVVSSLFSDCSQLPVISNGNITYLDSSNSTMEARITCDLNYRLVGNDVIVCLEDGNWDDKVPLCDCKHLMLFNSSHI